MGAIISLNNRWIKISNGSCEKVFDDAITVAKHHASSDVEIGYLARLEDQRKGFFTGYCPDLDALFPSVAEKKFWVRCFYDAGRWLHEGRLENPPGGGSSPAMWIFNTYWCAELLCELIGREDRDWTLNDEDTLLRAKERERYLEAYRIKHEAATAKSKVEQQEEMKSRALRDIKYASRHCPDCGYPVSDWLPTCRVCGFKVGRFNSPT
jgi:hypothetical protein